MGCMVRYELTVLFINYQPVRRLYTPNLTIFTYVYYLHLARHILHVYIAILRPCRETAGIDLCATTTNLFQ